MASSRKRSKTSGETGLATPSSSTIGQLLKFTKKDQKERFEKLKNRSIEPNRYICFPTLRTLGLFDEIDIFIRNIGWERFVQIRCPSFHELTYEFLTTFNLDKSVTDVSHEGTISFRLMNREFGMSITEFSVACGFYTEEYTDSVDYDNSYTGFPSNFNPNAFWREITDSPINYNPSQSKSSVIKSPALKYMHRFIAFSLSGRKESTGVVTKTDLFYLWCMVKGSRVNLGSWFAYFIDQNIHKKKGSFVVGTYITHIAETLGVYKPSEHKLTKACDIAPLDIECLIRMGLVTRQGSTVRLVGLRQEDEIMTEPVEERVEEEEPPVDVRPDPSTSSGILERLERLELGQQRMEQNLWAYFQFVGFTPPHPPPSSD